MKEIKLKEASKKTKVAFGSSGKRLGERSPADIEKLAMIALESQDDNLLGHFESIPTLEELRSKKADAELPKIPAKEKDKADKAEAKATA